MCKCVIEKGSLRFGEYYYGHGDGDVHGDGGPYHCNANRRYYHDACVLQRVSVETMPPAQRLRLELQRTKLMQEYSAGRVLLAQRRELGLLKGLQSNYWKMLPFDCPPLTIIS
jgi:hypothetical protein